MTAVTRDYSIVGAESTRAEAAGLADGRWFRPAIDADRLAVLTERRDLRPIVELAIWVALVVGVGVVAWHVRDTWWAIPAFAMYGALYGGSADARWHEFGHGTAARTNWINELVYYPASFMLAREPTYWRWSHFRHHTDTLVVGRDPEIIFPRPPSFARMALTFSNVVGGPVLMWGAVRHALGRPDPVVDELVPESDRARVVWEARAFVALWAAAVGASLLLWTPWPVLFVGGPTIYGAWLMVFFGATQHAGLREDVLDHRYSTRTVRMNPVFRFLYLNMNHHVEHHIFPTVPYYNLPALHAEIADQLPPVVPSTAAAYGEIFRAVRHQSADPTWELDRPVPEVDAPRARVIQAFERPDGENSVDVGSADLELGAVRAIEVDGRSLLLVRTMVGDYAVVDRRCTHGDADLADGVVLECEIECPKHNGRFDLRSGAATRRPAAEPLAVYPIRSHDGRVEVEL